MPCEAADALKMAMPISPSGGGDDFGDENGLFESHCAIAVGGKVR